MILLPLPRRSRDAYHFERLRSLAPIAATVGCGGIARVERMAAVAQRLDVLKSERERVGGWQRQVDGLAAHDARRAALLDALDQPAVWPACSTTGTWHLASLVPLVHTARMRKRGTLSQVRRSLYLTQRTIGDVQAAQRGTLARRVARRSLVRALLRGVR